MDKESCIRNIINTFDENGVFSEEQVTVLSKSLVFIVDSIDEWMYTEVLPKLLMQTMNLMEKLQKQVAVL